MPSEPSPFVIEVLDRDRALRAYVRAPLSARLVDTHNAPAFFEGEVASDDSAVPALLATGARMRLTYAGTTYTGRLRRGNPRGPKVAGRVGFEMEGDLRIATGCLVAWPRPAAGLNEQTVEYDVRTGPAETVVKGLVAANAVRAGVPLRVAPDQGRGGRMRVNGRMHPTGDLLLPLVDKAGIGLSVVQDGPGYVLDVYTPRPYPRRLTEAGGTVVDWQLNREAPTCTRVVVGGGGEGVDRDFILVVDEARETEWGEVIEVFRDADDAASDYNQAREARAQAQKDLAERGRDVTEADLDHRLAVREASGVADALTRLTTARTERDKAVTALDRARATEVRERDLYRAELHERARETLAEGAPKFGLSVTLSGTEHFRLGGVRVGDLVPVEVGDGYVHTDVLREAVVDWTADDGLSESLVVGEVTGDTTDRLVGAVAATARAARRAVAER